MAIILLIVKIYIDWLSEDFFMGFWEKVAAYRTIQIAKQDTPAPKSLTVAIIIVGGLSLLLYFIYNFVQSVLQTFSVVTVPATALLMIWLMTTFVGPYSDENTEALLGGGQLAYVLRVVCLATAIGICSSHPEIIATPRTFGKRLIMIPVGFMFLFTYYKIFHLPWECTRLLLRSDQGMRYVVVSLLPFIISLLSAVFGIEYAMVPNLNLGIELGKLIEGSRLRVWTYRTLAINMSSIVALGFILKNYQEIF